MLSPVSLDSLVPSEPTRRRIAVVGAGVAGLTAAWLLAPAHQVVLFEQEARLGGHTHTIVLPDGPDAGTAIDTGFIVFNEPNYPMFGRLLARLEVASQPSDMSFSFHRVGDGFHYAGTGLDGLFSHRRNLLSPAFYRLLGELQGFNARARRDLAAGVLGDRTIGEYVASLGLSDPFRDAYLAPMASAIWSMPPRESLDYPAAAFLRFFEQHGLLRLTGAPRWRTIVGGSQTYVRALLAQFTGAGGAVRSGAPVTAVRRDDDGVEVATAASRERFDDVVIATHADQALALLADPTPDERRLLGAWRYTTNRAVLHSDPSVLPPRRRAWAAWNYEEEPARSGLAPVCVTYWMNRLQRLETERTWCVTLNRQAPVDEARVVARMTYSHPRYDRAALASQAELPGLNGVRRTYYCGSYFRYGFHEDAVASAAEVGRAFGAML